MVRTVIALEDDDKAWLDRRAAEEGVPMTEIVRRAVRLLRERERLTATREIGDLLEATSGIWANEDGLEYQERMRDEW